VGAAHAEEARNEEIMMVDKVLKYFIEYVLMVSRIPESITSWTDPSNDGFQMVQ
jgi:hypothetical protein